MRAFTPTAWNSVVREDGELRPATWERALQVAATGIAQAAAIGGNAIGGWVTPSSTVEEGFLLQRLVRHLGSDNLDHRLRRRDFRLEDRDPAYPTLGMPIAGLEQADAIVVVGSNLRREAPLLAHRVRKAALRGAAVIFINPARYEYCTARRLTYAGLDLAGGLRRLLADNTRRRALLPSTPRGARQPVILLARLPDNIRDSRQPPGRGRAGAQPLARVGTFPRVGTPGLSLAGVLPIGAGRPAAWQGGAQLAEMYEQAPQHCCS